MNTNLVTVMERRLQKIYPETDPLWCTDLALATVAVAGKNFILTTKRGRIPLVLSVLYIGHSRLACKSLPVDNVVIPIIKSLQKAYDKRFKDVDDAKRKFLISDSYTTEAFMKKGHENGINGLCFIDEFTKILSEVKNKGYMSGLLEQMSRVWDAKDLYRDTITHGEQIIKAPHMPLVATAAFSIIKKLIDDWFEQGEGNRFLYIFSDTPRVIDETLEEFHDEKPLQELIGLDSILNGLIAFSEKNLETKIILSQEAKEILYPYRLECRREAIKMVLQDDLSRKFAYLENLGLQAYRIAGILCLGDFDLSDPSFLITEKHAKRAVKIARAHWEQFLRLQARIERQTKPNRDEDDDKSWTRVVSILKSNDCRMLKSKLKKALKMSSKRFSDIITAMIGANVLTIETDAQDDRKRWVIVRL